MSGNGYTLLIVESPTIGRRLQKIVPQHVLVIPTKGYLWMPGYKPANHTLQKKAIPEKLEIRNLIRDESKKAVKIIVATDSDPSGDFIAWSIADDLRMENLYRGNLQALSKSAVTNLLINATLTNYTRLRKRLENRYLIRQLWHYHFPGISIKTAAIVTIFGTSGAFSDFKSAQGKSFCSLQPVNCDYGSQIEASAVNDQQHFQVRKPLSTFQVLELCANGNGSSLKDAQEKLYKLFETTHPFSDEGLITYPRTGACSFFEESWEIIRQQWIQHRSLNEFIPSSLQEVTPSACEHDSIRPADLNTDPDFISKHISSELGTLYKQIHHYTLQAISMPVSVSSMYQSKKFGTLFTSGSDLMDESIQLRPCLKLSGFGNKMNNLGVLRPSGFATYIEKAQDDGFVTLTPDLKVKPGKKLSAWYDQAERFENILTRLNELADDPNLQAETISGILTS